MTRRRFGSLRRLPSGRWQARFPLHNGELRAAPQTFATKTDAQRYLTTVEADQLRGVWRTPDAEVPLLDVWAARHIAAQRGRLTPKTQALYESLLRACISPGLGDHRLDRLQKIEVREWVAALTARGLSASRVRQALVVLSQVLDAAVDDDLIAVNPCRGVRPPRLPQTDPVILTPQDVARLHDAIRPPFPVLVDLLAYAGLRLGEAFALRRGSFDLASRLLTVGESLSETGGRLSFGPTKTHQRRVSTLPSFLADDVRAHLASMPPGGPQDLLFVGRTGQPLHYNAFRRWTWDPAARAADLAGVTPHDLRATCASWVADSIGVLEAAKRLGHSRSSITTRHYARPVEGRDLDVAARLDALRRDQP